MQIDKLLTDQGWNDWLRDTLRSGGSPESAVQHMVRSGFSVPLSVLAVESMSRVLKGMPLTLPKPLLLPQTGTVRACGREVRVVSTMASPNIVVFADVLTADECQTLIEMAQSRTQRTTTVNEATGQLELHENRKSEGHFFARAESPYLRAIEERLAELVQWPLDRSEGLQIMCYRPGGEFKPHLDTFDPATGGAVHLKNGGQRVGTLILYLCDVEEGGATIFPKLGVSVAPQRGMALFFATCLPDGRPDPATVHGGAPVIRGNKWIATKWLRQSLT